MSKQFWELVTWLWNIHGRWRPQGFLQQLDVFLFYNSWKETFGKLKRHCSEFRQWLIHSNTHKKKILILCGYCPYSLVPDPHISWKCESSWKCETSLCKKYVLFRLYSLSTKSYRLRVTYFWYPPSHVSKRKTYFWTKTTQGPQRTQGFLPQQDEFKLLEHWRCIVPNFTND